MNTYSLLIFLLFAFIVGCENQQSYKSSTSKSDRIIKENEQISAAYNAKRAAIQTKVTFETTSNLPWLKIPAEYPQKAIDNTIEGWVILVYTINPQGKAVDIKILENSGTDIFNESSIAAIRKFAFKPFIKDGKVESLPGVTGRFFFKLSE